MQTIDQLLESIANMPEQDRERLFVRISERYAGALVLAIRDDEGLQAVDLEEISRTYAVSTRSLLRYIESGQLKASRFGRKYQITVEELKRYFSSPRSRKSRADKGVKRKEIHG